MKSIRTGARIAEDGLLRSTTWNNGRRVILRATATARCGTNRIACNNKGVVKDGGRSNKYVVSHGVILASTRPNIKGKCQTFEKKKWMTIRCQSGEMWFMLPKCCSATPREQQNHVALEPKMWSAQSICPFLYLFSARINRLLYYVFLRVS